MRAFLAAIHRQEASRQLARLDASLLVERAPADDLKNVRLRLGRVAQGKG
jgi:hypothetical protein